jgi:hypothetical protein
MSKANALAEAKALAVTFIIVKVGHCIDMQKKTQPIPTGFFNINAWQ